MTSALARSGRDRVSGLFPGAGRDLRRLVLTLAAIGLAGCATARAAPPRRAPGVHPVTPQLFVDCRGPRTSAPTVVFEAGAYGTSSDWDLVMRDLASTTRVCAYDRAGMGRSPDRTGRPSVTAIARDLAITLDRAGETAPVILVGHSNGALYAETFARLSPGRVAGLVYVNGVTSDALDDPSTLEDLQGERRIADWAVLLGRTGLAGPVAGAMIADIGLDGEAADRKREALTAGSHVRASRAEIRMITGGLRTARALPPLERNIPIAVVVGAPDPDAPLAKAWRASEVKASARACRSWVVDAPGASHASPLGRDRAYVLSAIRWVQARLAEPASACA